MTTGSGVGLSGRWSVAEVIGVADGPNRTGISGKCHLFARQGGHDTPMARRLSCLLLAVMVLAAVSASCGLGDNTGRLGVVPRYVPAEADLRSALLTVPDLPSGFRADPGMAGRSDTNTKHPSPNVTGAECQRLFFEAPVNGLSLPLSGGTEVEARFTNADAAQFLTQTLIGSGDRVGLRSALEGYRTSPVNCREFSMVDKDGTVTVRLAAATFPGLGDESVALRVDISGVAEDVSIGLIGYILMIRIGGTLCLLSHMGFPGVSEPNTEQLAKIALAKLAPIARPR